MEIAQTAMSGAKAPWADGRGQGQNQQDGRFVAGTARGPVPGSPENRQGQRATDQDAAAAWGSAESRADFNLNRKRTTRTRTATVRSSRRELVEGEAVLNDSAAGSRPPSASRGEVSEGRSTERDPATATGGEELFRRLKEGRRRRAEEAPSGSGEAAPAAAPAAAEPAKDAK